MHCLKLQIFAKMFWTNWQSPVWNCDIRLHVPLWFTNMMTRISCNHLELTLVVQATDHDVPHIPSILNTFPTFSYFYFINGWKSQDKYIFFNKFDCSFVSHTTITLIFKMRQFPKEGCCQAEKLSSYLDTFEFSHLLCLVRIQTVVAP